MKLFITLCLAVTVLCSRVSLPSYPLAVKNPYLSAWLPGGKNTDLTTSQPVFWTQAPLTWLVVVRVNDQPYCLLGCNDNSIPTANQTDLESTSTRTRVTLQAGSATFLLNFLSPVSLTNYVRQSIPFSYLTIVVKQAQQSDTLDILSAIDDTWTGQSQTQLDFSKGQNSLLYSLSGQNSVPLTENKQMAAYGQVVLAAESQGSSVSYQTGSSQDILSQFKSQGVLTSSSKTSDYNSGDLVAFSYRLKNGGQDGPVTFAVGLVREPTIQWLNEPQAAYYQSQFDTTEDVVDHFFSDMGDAADEADQLDAEVVNKASSISSNYADILESTVRQAWGGFELTVPMDTKDTSKAKAFMKEISTDGNVNTLGDLLPKAFPIFYVLAPEYIRLLLEPVMEYTLQWPANYAFHDLGKHYPKATGETVDGEEKLLLDQTSVLQWMVYAYQKISGNKDWVKPYLGPLETYADYLAGNGLHPPAQRSSVDSIAPTANQTILAIYSAIGLTAYGALSGDQNYTDIGQNWAPKIINLASDSKNTHIKSHYDDDDDSWVTTYPFAFDVLLDLNTFSKETNAMQSDWYEKQMEPYGLQLDDGVPYTVADLSIWAAATSSNKVLNAIIDGAHDAFTNNLNVCAGPTQWNVTGANKGEWFLSTAKSNVGSYWMPLAVNTGN